jgi:hypothetical protein
MRNNLFSDVDYIARIPGNCFIGGKKGNSFYLRLSEQDTVKRVFMNRRYI